MKIRKYTFCTEFNWGRTLYFLWRWRHYREVTCTQNTVRQCSVLPSSFILQLASVKQQCELQEKRTNSTSKCV